VIARFVETFFRHKLLILLPALVTPLLVMPFAFLLVRPYYETIAGVWIERPAYMPVTDDTSRYVTPAQYQQTRLNELLLTRTFTEDIARRTSLASLLDSPQGREDVVLYLQRAIYPLPAGNSNKLLGIRVRADDPDLSMEIMQGTLAAFRERAQNERVSQATAAISFYEGQLKAAEDERTKAQDGVRRYLASNPRLAQDDPRTGATARANLPTAALDPQLSELVKRLEADDRDVERIRTLLEQARFDASAALDGSDSSLQVVDPPVKPTRAQREQRRFFIFPIAAVAIGLLVSALLLIGLTASDRSVRSSADLNSIGRVIGVIPRMGLRRLPRQAGPETTRRAIAFVAGTTLPALPAPRKAI
jgi:hypothetical protein